MSSIAYLKHKDIDKKRWDSCISKAMNGNLYAWSWYLDAVSPGWDALILGDYEALMPLTRRTKWGIHYLYRPLLNQQLGVFSQDLHLVSDPMPFLDALPAHFRLVEITLNKYNTVPEGIACSRHTSYELDLVSHYDDLRKNYKQNTVRNIKKAEKSKVQLDLNVEASDFINLLWKDQSDGSAILLKPDNFEILLGLLAVLKENNAGRIIGMRDEGGDLTAATLFGFSHHKWYNLAPVANAKGKEMSAQFMVTDALIREYAGQPLTLDFEGSDLPGVARFYAGFGAQPYQYAFFVKNKLPWLVKLMKRMSR